MNLLAFVIPPMANGTLLGDHLDKWCYQYHYDAKKRLVEKKLPQKDWEYIIYDKADRVVMTGPVYNPFGDGNKGWLITKYDLFGRSIYTGYYASSTFSSAERNSLAQNNFTVESKSGSNITIDDITTRYTNTSFPTSFKLLSVNYYDNYSYPGAPTSFPTVETQSVNTALKGQLTGTWRRILTTSSSTAGNMSYNFYDNKYRVIRSYSANHLGGYTQVDSKLNFTGTPSKTITYQKQNSNAAILTITDVLTYDRRDRLTKQTEQIGTGVVETIVSNTYDELGVLVTKNVGGSSGGLQTVDYKYNIRGWLTDINNADYFHNDTQNDLFQFKINYNNSVAGGKAQYNGNISSVFSRTKTDNIFRGYNYSYDHLNRLLLGKNLFYEIGGWTMGINSNDFYDEAVNYDKNGNIITLNRTSKVDDQKVDIDILTYDYNGNQLLSVTDHSSPTVNDGFKDGNKVGDDYAYDTFGNITQDKNKGITDISYNHLNLPYQVTFGNGSNIKYTYDAAGTRLKKQVQPSGGALVTTDYVNGFEYKNDILQTFSHAEGYVENKYISNDGVRGRYEFFYHYIYRDHLGNNRLVYADLDGNGIIDPATEIVEENNYYPFGLKHKGYNELAGNGYKYKFGGKELNDELGLDLYDFGARNYDAAIGRWLNVDPLAEVSRRWTPYNYAYNNPIYFVDPDGMLAIDHDKRRVISTSGNSQMVKSYTYSGGVNYNYDIGKRNDKVIFPGMTRIQHSHTLPISPNNSIGSSTQISANYVGSRLVGTDVITSVTESVTNASGKYYDSNNNLVDNIKNASTYVVQSSTTETTINVGVQNISETANVKETTTKTIYDVIDKSNMKEMGGLQLANKRESVTSQKNSSMKTSEVSKNLLKTATESSKFNAGKAPNPAAEVNQNVMDRTMNYEEEMNKHTN